MDVREKLVELLQHDNCPLFMVFGDKVDVLADYLIVNGVTVQDNTEISEEFLQQLRNAPLTILHEEPTIEVVQEWISVKDRLPKDTYEYWVAYKGGNDYFYTTGYFDGKYWRATTTLRHIPVTHWQPLPQPPKGE